MTYNRFIEGLRKANVMLNRKALANMAIENPEGMKQLVALAKNMWDDLFPKNILRSCDFYGGSCFSMERHAPFFFFFSLHG